jgi:hypothetical protein
VKINREEGTEGGGERRGLFAVVAGVFLAVHCWNIDWDVA